MPVRKFDAWRYAQNLNVLVSLIYEINEALPKQGSPFWKPIGRGLRAVTAEMSVPTPLGTSYSQIVSIMLTPGMSRAGQIIDPSFNDLLQAANLTMDKRGRVEVEIPFIDGIPQFEQASRWFRERKPPETLVFAEHAGMATMTGIRWARHTGSSFVTGTLQPDCTILGRPRRVKTSYKLREMMTNMDGLTPWANFRPVETSDEAAGTLTVTVAAPSPLSFRVAGFTYSIVENAPWSARSGSRFHVESEAAIVTHAHRGATPEEHLTAQWPIRALLTLLYAAPIRWRRHRIRDSTFPTWMLAGPPRLAIFTDLIHARTAEDATLPAARDASFAVAALDLADLGTRGLRRWVSLYQDDVFRRAIEPAVEVLNGASKFLEPQVMMLAMALDALGFYRDPDRRSGTAMWAQIDRCITAANVDVSRIGSSQDVARLIANTNNDLKHPDRLERPDHLRLTLVADLATTIFRCQLFDLLSQPEERLRRFVKWGDADQALAAFSRNRVRVGAGGHLVPT
ncbi:hypothetical protein EDF46_2511 [Frondihabitans sp. PhB188]|nr:hypothetical protein EDF46_2511 [Frondihabitans sp. PhB188]